MGIPFKNFEKEKDSVGDTKVTDVIQFMIEYAGDK